MRLTKSHSIMATLLLSTLPYTGFAYTVDYSKLWLSVQKEGQPLFHTLELTIYKLDHDKRYPIYNSNRHTAVLPLEPGQYAASATFENKTVEKHFQLKSLEDEFLVLNID